MPDLTNDRLKYVVELSIVPGYAGTITATNKQQNFTSELRRMPALNLVVGMTEAYPSSEAPIVKVVSRFYKKYEKKIISELSSRWSEGMPVLFEYVNYIWDELIDQLFGASKNLHFDFNTNDEFQAAYDES